MNRFTKISGRGAVALAAAGAAAAGATPAAVAATAPPSKVGTTLTVQGLGALRLGVKPAQVSALLGKPARIVGRTVNGTVIQIYRYPRYGLKVVFGGPSAAALGVDEVSVASRRYRMVDTGLRVGAALATVKKAYPQGRCASSTPGGRTVICTDNGGEGGINFVLRNGKRVSSIYVDG
ncbi:hypothetical protein [Capillimicrobium parvum]|uniref:Uncharacterized protein n=1 Tax=Capillimicrobium parvum TaxID=2884022 RepID=A0A9E7BZD9_9ACTN|nr:hypothetical protein [Capillimicrobium parvum]UGS34288.1 hypothetical protein DSM104329_00664 [Capillimicrobium parvum]